MHSTVSHWPITPCCSGPSHRVTLAHHTVLHWSIRLLLWPITVLHWSIRLLHWPITLCCSGPSHRVTLAHHTVIHWSISLLHWPITVLHWSIRLLHWPITSCYTGQSHRVTLVHQTVILAHHRVTVVHQTVTLAFHTVLQWSIGLLHWPIRPCYTVPQCYTGLQTVLLWPSNYNYYTGPLYFPRLNGMPTVRLMCLRMLFWGVA